MELSFDVLDEILLLQLEYLPTLSRLPLLNLEVKRGLICPRGCWSVESLRVSALWANILERFGFRLRNVRINTSKDELHLKIVCQILNQKNENSK